MSNSEIIDYANNYFNRNIDTDGNISLPTIYLCDLLKNENIKTVCEVGCFIGTQLNYVCSNLNSKGIGIEPSDKATEKAKEKYKHLNFKNGFSFDLQIEDESQDLIMFGFFTYLLSESSYEKSINEAYKKIKKGKFFYILDFDHVSQSMCNHNNKFTISKRDHSHIKGFKLLEKKVYYDCWDANNDFSYSDDYSRISMWLYKKI